MILQLLKGRGMVSRLIEKKWDAIPPHPAPLQALYITHATTDKIKIIIGWKYTLIVSNNS
jgi:hypothetical protein